VRRKFHESGSEDMENPEPERGSVTRSHVYEQHALELFEAR